MEADDSEGNKFLPWGEEIDGLLMYSVEGWMSLQITRLDSVAKSVEKYHAYYGTYEVDEVNQFVTHKIQASLNTDWNHVNQVRYFQIKGTALILRSPFIEISASETPVRVTTIWERIS